ncbi:hypothetical protein D9M71_86220 [compost metagenome]
MGERRDRRNPETGAPGPGGVRRESTRSDAHGLLPGLHPPGARHPADGGVRRRRAARRGNGAAGPGADRRAHRQPHRGAGSADAGDPAAAGLSRTRAERAPRPADDRAAAAQRPACRARRKAALGNQPVLPRPVAQPPGAAAGRHRTDECRRTAGAAAQAAADAAGGAGRGDPQPGNADQPRLHGQGLRPPGNPLRRGAGWAALAHRRGGGGEPGQWQPEQRHLHAHPAAPG